MNDYSIASVLKAFEIIELMSQNNGGLTVSQIALRLDSSVSSISRFLLTLSETSFVKKDASTNKYYLTDKFLIISNRLLNQNPLLDKYVPIAHYFSNKYSATVNINSFFDNKVFLLYKIMKFYAKDLDFKIGDSIPAYCCSAGKIFLSQMDNKALDEYFSELDIIKYQSRTLSSEKEIREEIILVRKNGYAVHDEEYAAGIVSISFSLMPCAQYLGVITLIVPSSEKHKILNADTIAIIQKKLAKP